MSTTTKKRTHATAAKATTGDSTARTTKTAYQWPKPAKQVVLGYLRARVSGEADPRASGCPLIDGDGVLRMHASDWIAWLTENGMPKIKNEGFAAQLQRLAPDDRLAVDVIRQLTPDMPALACALDQSCSRAPGTPEQLNRRLQALGRLARARQPHRGADQVDGLKPGDTARPGL